MTMMDSLDIIASCDLELGLYCKLIELIEDYLSKTYQSMYDLHPSFYHTGEHKRNPPFV